MGGEMIASLSQRCLDKVKQQVFAKYVHLHRNNVALQSAEVILHLDNATFIVKLRFASKTGKAFRASFADDRNVCPRLPVLIEDSGEINIANHVTAGDDDVI